MDDDAMDRLLSGDLGRLPNLPKRLVRLFISSTFTDMILERNTLMERVYPRLKKYCREKHGLDFQVVDMRWGVRDEATDDHQTVNLCSREIENCQRVSLGPNFIALIGDKYGFRPLLNRIKSTEYRLLRRCLIESDINTDFLDTWYKEDLNAVPPEYVLQPISSILKNFTNRNEPELQMVDQRIWQAIQERLQELLLIGSSRLVKQGRMSEREQLLKYSISVTEREVLEGCLDMSEPRLHCLVYVRSIVDLRDHLDKCTEALKSNKDVAGTLDATTGNSAAGTDLRRDSATRKASLKIGEDTISLTTSKAQTASERKIERTRRLIGRYIDLAAKDGEWHIDEGAQEALKDLREVKLTTRLASRGRNLTYYRVHWNEQDGISSKLDEHKNYLNNLTDHFYANLTRMVRGAVKAERGKTYATGLLGEVLQHSHYALQVGKSVYARKDELDQIRSYILSGQYRRRRNDTALSNPILPMFIFGVSGSGKTSIMARAASAASSWIEEASKRRRSSANLQPSDMLRSSPRTQTRRWDRKPCVIIRFCCTTPASSSMVGMLTSVCRQLQYNFYQFGPLNGLLDQEYQQRQQQHCSTKYKLGKYDQIPYQQVSRDFVRLVYTFRQLVDNCRHPLHRQRLFVILLDSIERLSSSAENSIEAKYSWLTSITKLPSNVRLIVSCSSTGESNAKLDYAYLKRHFLIAHLTSLNQMNPDSTYLSDNGSVSSSSSSSEERASESLDFSDSNSSISEHVLEHAEEPDNRAQPTRYGQLLKRLVLPAIRLKRGSRADAGSSVKEAFSRLQDMEPRQTIRFASEAANSRTSINKSPARESVSRIGTNAISESDYDGYDDASRSATGTNYLGLLHIRPLGKESGATVLRRWLTDSGRNLTQQQWTIVERSFAHCSRPIFVKLAFGEVINWKSYSTQGDTKGLTFGSAWLADMPTDSNISTSTDENPRAKLLKIVQASEVSRASEEEANKLKWQMLSMEQQWLNFLDYKSRKEQQAAANATAGQTENTNLVIKITGAGSVATCGSEQGNRSSNSNGFATTGGSSSMSICYLSNTIEDAISQLFARIELQHGYLLTKHSLSYITAARNGICENELEDILSLDDVVLDDVFQYHLPPVRRIPPLLWTRIRNDLPDYLSERDADGIVITWHHSQFKTVTEKRYLDDRKQVVYIHSLVADYFLGRWADKAKRFRCTKQQVQMAAEQLESAVQQSTRESASAQQGTSLMSTMRGSGRLGSGSARGGTSFSVRNRLRSSDQHDERLQWMQAKAHRRVPHQPLYYNTTVTNDSANSIARSNELPSDEKQNGSVFVYPEEKPTLSSPTSKRYNLRKLTELPYHLIRAGRFHELASCVLFNYKWLFASIEALSLQSLFADFQEALECLRSKLKDCSNDQACEIPSSQVLLELQSNDCVPSDELDVLVIGSMIEQIELLSSALRLSSSVIQSEPQMLAPQLIGRLVSVVNQMEQKLSQETKMIGRLQQGTSGDLKQPRLLSQLMQQCDKDGCADCALIPTDHCLQSPDGFQLSSLEGHPFGVMSMVLSSDQRHLLAASSKFIMWNISTGEIVREIDPKISGAIMKELKISANNQLVIAYTSDNHILVLDILTQQLAKYARSFDSGSIRGLKLIDRLAARRFFIWTRSSLFVFKRNNQSVVLNDNQILPTGRDESDAILVEPDYEIDLSEVSKGGDLLDVVLDSLDDASDLIHCILDNQANDAVRLSVCCIKRSGGSLLTSLWNCNLDAASLVLCPSGKQIFYSTQDGDIFLSRRRAKSWSNRKLIRRAVWKRVDNSDVASEIGSSRVPLSLEVGNPVSTVDGVRLEQQMSDIEWDNLQRFERRVDRILDGDEIDYPAIFTKTPRGESKSGNKEHTMGVRFLKVYWPNRIDIIELGKVQGHQGYEQKVLNLPRDVRNVRIEQNKCQLCSVIMQVPEEGDEHFLIVSSIKQLLVYSVDSESLLKSIDAHVGRITKLLPIKQATEISGELRFSIASSSLDRTVKIWNLSNITKESQSIGRLALGQIDEMQICSQKPIVACLSRGRLSLWDWRTMKIVASHNSLTDVDLLSSEGSERKKSRPTMKCVFSSNGRYLATAKRDAVSLLLVESITKQSTAASLAQTSPETTDHTRLKLVAEFPLPKSGIVIKLKFVAHDSRVLAVVRCSREISWDWELSSSPSGSPTTTDSMSESSTLDEEPHLGLCINVFCFVLSDLKLQYQIECQMAQTRESDVMARQVSSSSREKMGQQDWRKAKRGKLVALTCDQQFIVIVCKASSNTSITNLEPSPRRRSVVSRVTLELNVYSTRDGSLIKKIDLTQLQKMDKPSVRRWSQKGENGKSIREAKNELQVQSEMTKQQSDGVSRAGTTAREGHDFVSVHSDQFNRIKSIKSRDRQTLVALLDDERGTSYIIDIASKCLICYSNDWNGAGLSSDGRHGLSRVSSSASGRNFATQTVDRVTLSGGPMDANGLRLLEMRRCGTVKTILDGEQLSKLGSLSELQSRGTDREILCGFTRPNDGYVYYCDSRLKRILLIRLRDSQLIANYKLSCPITKIKCTNDGFALVLAQLDGSLTSLAIVDPQASDSFTLLTQYPSRRKLQ